MEESGFKNQSGRPTTEKSSRTITNQTLSQANRDALYGSTTVSDTFGEGITEKVSIMPQVLKINVCRGCLEVEFDWRREQKRIERTLAKRTASEMRSGYSSRTLEISNVPIPAPVPPPREWQSWKPCKPGRDLKHFLHVLGRDSGTLPTEKCCSSKSTYRYHWGSGLVKN